jgi:hypothetical protein
MAAVAFAAPLISTFVLEADALASDGHQFCGNQTNVQCPPNQQGNDDDGDNNQGNDDGDDDS